MKNILYLIAFITLASLQVNAQSAIKVFKSTSNLATDTVVNTATEYLTSPVNTGNGPTTIQVVVTKISGTVGGTISLQGSVDGTSYKALNTEETQTALATITATDASNVYHWRLKDNPFLYYRVNWVGTGTMSATVAAKLITFAH
jgi:hypothetical protein